jgi:hypothetical protein
MTKYDPSLESMYPRRYILDNKGMSSSPEPDDWRAGLVWAHHYVFLPPERHPELAEGLPECSIGWLEILMRLCIRIEFALAAATSQDEIKLVQIKEKYGTLRVCWEGHVSKTTRARVEKAIDLARARSACTCEFCGEEGWLYRRGDWLTTACPDHAKGERVLENPKLENVYITHGTVDGEAKILSCRRYDRETDSFVDIDPASLPTQ